MSHTPATRDVLLVDCPRDAMQGLHSFIPTEAKVRYLNTLLRAGFHTLDCASFVSAKAIPQLADSAQVLEQLDLAGTDTKLLAIVVNERGIADAATFPQVSILGYPFSISETFQLRNSNKTLEQSWDLLARARDAAAASGKELLVYLSMGFGNPYGDPWSPQLVTDYAGRMGSLGIRLLMLADTVGTADPDTIRSVFGTIIPALPGTEVGAHLHASARDWRSKVQAAWDAGCRRYDGAMRGYGGCPFAKDELVGNVPTEGLYHWLEDTLHQRTGLNHDVLKEALALAAPTFAMGSVE